MHFTIHAGEAFGLPSIWEAIQWCGTDRLGHGVRIVDDIVTADDGTAKLGRLAAYVRDRRIPLEMCPSSNVQTGAARVDRRAPDRPAAPAAFPDHGQHRQPADERHLDDRVRCSSWWTRSATSSAELQWFTVNALKSAFIPFDERLALIDEVVKPGYLALASQTSGSSGISA